MEKGEYAKTTNFGRKILAQENMGLFEKSLKIHLFSTFYLANSIITSTIAVKAMITIAPSTIPTITFCTVEKSVV